MDVTYYAPVNIVRKSATRPSQEWTMATTYDWSYMMTNARAVWARATEQDIVDGSEWYVSIAPSLIDDMATRYSVDYCKVAAVVAIFSAMCEWTKNVEATDKFLRAYVIDGKRGRELPAVVMSSVMLRKAEAILDGADPETTIVAVKPDHVRSHKTLTFYHNLIGDWYHGATIDVWMVRALFGIDTDYRPSGWHYRMIESVIVTLAAEHDMAPAHVQAILWTVIRGSAH